MTSTDTTTETTTPSPSGFFAFSTFGSVKINDGSRVDIPAERAADFARAATYFSSHSNRFTLTITMPTEAEAKLLAKQLRQWAEDHGLTCAPKREVCAVTFRFSKPAAASKNGPVTTTTVAERAAESQAGAENAAKSAESNAANAA
jgi:hypothetical protein